jgi:DNA-binding PadR family transcriptional regulator
MDISFQDLYSAGMSRANDPATVTQAGFLVLVALAIDDAHGYALMQFAEEATGGGVRLPPGTLYRTISRLLAAGLVEEIEREDPNAPHDARRRYYRLTETGRQAAEDEVQLLARLFGAASRAGLAGRATEGGVGDAGVAVASAAETPQEVAPEFPPRIHQEGLGAARTSEGLPRMTMGPWRRRPKATFRREGEYWSIAFHSDAFRLRDSKGLRHLSVLLAAPGREFHSLELVVTARGDTRPEGHGPAELSSGTGDAGEILDERAKTEYRYRLRDLESELAEAENWNDSERVARLREEIDFLARELGAAVGLGGRDRRAASAAERARVNVTRAIKAALERIAKQSPTLGRHLSVTIRTGTFCAYQPDPRVPVTWSS